MIILHIFQELFEIGIPACITFHTCFCDVFQHEFGLIFTHVKNAVTAVVGLFFMLCDYKYFARVPNNYHLLYDDHYYSVLYTYYNQPAILKATMAEIRICDRNNKLICTHRRYYKDFPKYITKPEHMAPEHQYYKEVNSKDGAYYRRWASSIGPYMVKLIDAVL